MKTLLQSILLLLCATALGQDNVIPFQGQLADQVGVPLTPPSPVTIVFRLYRAPVGGEVLWEEAQPNLSVNAGRFSVLLGSRSPLPGYTNFNATLYLGLTVDDGNPATTDVEMRPRQALVPVISASYAKQAQNADKLNGFDWSALFGVNNPQGNILGSRIAAGTVTASQIAPQTVTGAQIAPATIAAAQIVPATITSNQIAPETITSSQIADGTIDIADLAQQVAEALVPPGTIVSFGGENVPAGWLLCDGTQVSRSSYARLFTAIDTAWGQGNGSTTFNLPDLRGYFLRGVDGNAGRDPNATSRTAINPGGNFGDSVGSAQADEFKSHHHEIRYDNTDGWAGNRLDGDSDRGLGGAVNTGVTGGSETRPKNAYVNYIIKF